MGHFSPGRWLQGNMMASCHMDKSYICVMYLCAKFGSLGVNLVEGIHRQTETQKFNLL